ncbi:MAG: superfamily II DNA or RNA helicase [Lentimonas sp.]|jgi:superfamily II DNA or RNA helicase
MRTKQNRLDGLEGFERLDVGELYYIGNRQFVEQGLACYRNFAVEGLEWDGHTKRLTASVSSSGIAHYDVWLQIRSGRLEHACDCTEWVTYGGCKHAVAATAAMFLAVQGKSVGGADMPPDYAQDLRKQLGYRDVGGIPGAAEGGEYEEATELWLTEIRELGNLDFQINGPMPTDFLRSVGVTLPSSYGFSVVREFSLNVNELDFAQFLSEAQTQEITVMVGVFGDNQPLELHKSPCTMRVVYDYSKDEVTRQLYFEGAKKQRLMPYCLIPRSSYVILMDGSVRRVKNVGDDLAGDLGPIVHSTDPESFNESAYQRDYEQMAQSHAFLVDGEPLQPQALTASEIKICLDLRAVENAAGERESLEYDLFARVGELELDLYRFQSNLLNAVTGTAYGKLLSAKRRVSSLLDLIRRVLSANQEGRLLDLCESAEHFPELLSEEYGDVVRQIVDNVVHCSGNTRSDVPRLVVDDLQARWLACQIPFSKVAMLLFSMFDAQTRDDLKGLGEGVMALSRHESNDGVLQRLVSVCAALGVQVRFNEKAIRSAPLSITLQGNHGGAGKDIDWFELHPSITCADRTITAAEWKRLIRGQLFLETADGSLIMPQVGEGETDGLQMIAEVLQRGISARGGNENTGTGRLQISRLEMLDWIALRRKGVQLELPEAVEAVFESLQKFDGLKAFTPPASLKAELRPYQKEGCAWIEFMYQHRFGACLADDMGLGKTVQTIAFLTQYFENQGKFDKTASVLIVVPPSLVFNWLDEFERFAPHLRVVDCLSRSQWKPSLNKAQVVLTTYDRVRVEAKTMEMHEFEVVVFDEAHNLKNVSTARTKAAAKLRRRFTLCLTGTPVENNVSEFFSVLTATVPGIFGTLKDFKENYREHPQRTLKRAAPFVLRRTKDKILKELPKKEEHELFLEMSPVQKEIYTRTISEVRAEVALAYEDRPEQQAGIVALAAILRLRQVCVSPVLLGKPMDEPAPKFSHMADQLEELEAEGNAALVFSQFIGGLDQMEVVAKARGISYLRMDGRTPVSQRKDLVRLFQSENGPSFFFISLKTGGVGLNLTRANYVFHLDPWWNPAVENQASDRAHRIGQTRSVFVQRLIMKHTIEARMLELKAQKAELFRQLVEEPGGKSASASLSRRDFDYLLNGE